MPKTARKSAKRQNRRVAGKGTAGEAAEHAKLKSTLIDIATRVGIKADTEVVLNFSGDRDGKKLRAECSIDVALFGSLGGKRFLIIFECKKGGVFDEVHKKLSAWEANIEKIGAGTFTLVPSSQSKIKASDIKDVAIVRVCYVFGRSMDSDRFASTSQQMSKRGFYAWDDSALAYYVKTASTIRAAARYEIFREFGLGNDPGGTKIENAVQIKQEASEMYLLGIEPSVLLKIAYVSRRASGRPRAYQRILSGDRIARLTQFLNSGEALLPNAIIIAFDSEPGVQKLIKFDDGKLQFPEKFCSAWIIDGQHRVYGFLDTKHETEGDDTKPEFKLPVVAFRSMDLLSQNRTFVNINYNQKRIDPTLLCDLATELPDLHNELTWPSLLGVELNKLEPLKNKIKISELHEARPIAITSFARYALLEGLLGFEKKGRTYKGPLYKYSPFSPKASVKNSRNRRSMSEQVDLLRRYFNAVHSNTSNTKDPTKDPWMNWRKYALLKPTGINALLLVLSRVLEKYPSGERDIGKDFPTYLNPLRKMRFTRASVVKQGGGWKGFRNLANAMIRRLNSENGDALRLFGAKEKS